MLNRRESGKLETLAMANYLLIQEKFRFRAVAVGGTFDILHIGHEKLLAKAFELGELVFVGVTGDRLVSKLNKDHAVRKFALRRRDLRRLLKARGWLRRARIIELKDPFGPATRRKRLDALVVSEETRSNGLRVNALRRNQGLDPLKLYVVRMVMTKDGLLLSDTRIRRGEVNPQGKLKVKVPTRIR
jgi:pantetheine-phosphate adenylyltransferase